MKDKPISPEQRVKDGIGCGVPVRLICNSVREFDEVKDAINQAGNKAQQAYGRSDALEARRPLMARWAEIVSGA